MAKGKAHPKLPTKCVNKKAAYMPVTNWWCSFCAPTGGKVCWFVCKYLGETR